MPPAETESRIETDKRPDQGAIGYWQFVLGDRVRCQLAAKGAMPSHPGVEEGNKAVTFQR